MKFTRRGLIKTAALVGGGVAIGFYLRPADPPWPHREAEDLQPNAFLQVDPGGNVTFTVHKAEMGQGVITGMLTLAAEELSLAPERIHYRHAPVHPDFAGPGLPLQLTAGSSSLRESYMPVREAAATLRQLLVAAAAQELGIAQTQLECRDGAVHTVAGDRSIGFGELVPTARDLPLPDEPRLKPAAEFRWIGRHNQRVDNQDKVTGKAQYGLDARAEGAAVAVVVRCPHFGGRLARYDDSKAREVRGAVDVFPLGNGVALVADSYWRARKMAEALEVSWEPSAAAALDSQTMRDQQRALLRGEETQVVREDGEAPTTVVATMEAEYALPFLAHATMEPLNALAIVRPEGVYVELGTQGPDLTRTAVAQALQRPEAEVTVQNTMLGGGFGRRSMGDEAVEAALIAERIGRPVRLIWSREDDMQHDFYRPAMMGRLRAQIGDDGSIGWYHRVVGPSIMGQHMPQMLGNMLPGWVPGFVPETAADFIGARGPASVEGAKELPYQFGGIQVEYTQWDPGVPVGYWRSVGHSHTAFVVESFIDELAHKLERDPLAFRRDYLREPRHLAALELAAEKAGWGNPPPGRFHGLAVHESFETVVAQVAEVSIENGEVRVHRVISAVHCGLAVNPDIVAQQVESSVIYGLTAALYGEITLQDGAVQQGNFDDYPLLRMDRAPVVETYIVPSDEPPTGIGEPGLPPLAPAVANAVYAATGKRIRELPLRL